MALMYPRTLNPEDVESAAEVVVFDRLRDQLDNKWECFHSASWMIRHPKKGATDGEIDFVIAHPGQGILCLEVKGGGIECRNGAWYRIEHGKSVRMKDPFKQALDHRYALKRKISKQKGWKNHDLFLAHGVCFTDITVHKLVLAPDAPPEIVIDKSGIEDLNTSLARLFDYHRGHDDSRQPPGEEGMKMLRDLLAPQIR
ncbi:MAG: NERD domain-containing protein, partial [Solirubrobacterales bacterium]|nr:NERD domain-containing protein [Solirubrobacterales bacterium]